MPVVDFARMLTLGAAMSLGAQVRADEVYGLENRKFQMQMGLEERKHETEVHAEILRASLKTVLEDMHRATLEVKERQLRTTRLQSKYEVMVAKRNMGGGDGDDGDHSQAYFVIKAAQVRVTGRLVSTPACVCERAKLRWKHQH
jgi:hypothetical protein